jgi:hypothetical protein
MDRRRRRQTLEIKSRGNGKLTATNQYSEEAPSPTPVPPSALEQAYHFLETGRLNDENYYQVRWRFYDESSFE